MPDPPAAQARVRQRPVPAAMRLRRHPVRHPHAHGPRRRRGILRRHAARSSALPPPTLVHRRRARGAFETFIESHARARRRGTRATERARGACAPRSRSRVPAEAGEGERGLRSAHLGRAALHTTRGTRPVHANTGSAKRSSSARGATRRRPLPEHVIDKQRGLDEFKNLGGDGSALRRWDARVTLHREVPEVAFTGDTTAEWIDRAVRRTVAATPPRGALLRVHVRRRQGVPRGREAIRAHAPGRVGPAQRRVRAVRGGVVDHFIARYKARGDAALDASLPGGLSERSRPYSSGSGSEPRSERDDPGKRPTAGARTCDGVGSKDIPSRGAASERSNIYHIAALKTSECALPSGTRITRGTLAQ